MTSHKLDPYAELGVEAGASDQDIEKAYRRRARQTHPDNGGSGEDFLRVASAVALLRDPERRKKYDETGETEQPRKRTVEQDAQELLDQLVSALIDTDNLQDRCDVDMVDVMRRQIDAELDQMGKSLRVMERKKAMASKLAKKFIRKDKGVNILQRVAQDKVRAINKKIEECRRVIAVFRAGRKMLDGYSFEIDRPDQQTVLMNHLLNQRFRQNV